MGIRFCVLGSGSGGNAALIFTPRARVLIDAGFTAEELAGRMAGTGASWDSLAAVVITHTHSDHLKKRTLKTMAERGISFHCHRAHLEELAHGRYLKRLEEAGLVRPYSERPFQVAGEFLFHPLPLAHDRPPTFGFRVEAADGGGRVLRIGYLSDLGDWSGEIAAQLCEVDLLALEFNHDEELERNSGRHQRLIARVLGEEGHLSNAQAAAAFERIITLGANGGPKQLVQMHLSRECNRPELAFQAARRVIRRTGAATKIFSSRQERRGTVHRVG